MAFRFIHQYLFDEIFYFIPQKLVFSEDVFFFTNTVNQLKLCSPLIVHFICLYYYK